MDCSTDAELRKLDDELILCLCFRVAIAVSNMRQSQRPGRFYLNQKTEHLEANCYFIRLGENPYTMSAIQSFLLDRVTVGDNDGALVTSILRVSKSAIVYRAEMLT